MNIGAVIERVQKVGDLLEKLIEQSNELRDRVIRLEENAEDTTDRVAVLDAELGRQTALLEAVAEDAGVDPADHEFTPHVTLARTDHAGGKECVRRAVEQRHPTVGATTVEAVRLTESELDPDGPEYATVGHYPL